MRKLTLIMSMACLVFFSGGCLKDNTDCQDRTVQSEAAQMDVLAMTLGMNATIHPSGIRYEIVSPGSGAVAGNNSAISVKYTGKLIDGTIFDQSTVATPLIPMSNLIAGWQIGIPLIQKGGKIRLIIPSSLAYGCKGKNPIPSSAILYFDVELIDVQ